MQVYKLTTGEREAIEALNTRRSNTLMIACDLGGEIGCVVSSADLDESIYADYRALVGETLDDKRLVEWTPE